MHFLTILRLKELLEHTSALQLHIYDSLESDLRSMDAGLRMQFETSAQLYASLRQRLTQELTANTILYLQDYFRLHYVIIPLDESANAFCSLGPFLSEATQSSNFLMYLRHMMNLPQFSASAVISAAHTILSLIGDNRQYNVKNVHLHADPALLVRLSTDQYNGSSTITRKLIYYIQANLHKKITLNTLAENVGFSPSYISHHFKEELGLSPMQYIIQQRILYAKYLLRHTDKPVQDVAGSVGIADWSYFTKLFREQTGITPTQYRKSHEQA